MISPFLFLKYFPKLKTLTLNAKFQQNWSKQQSYIEEHKILSGHQLLTQYKILVPQTPKRACTDIPHNSDQGSEYKAFCHGKMLNKINKSTK